MATYKRYTNKKRTKFKWGYIIDVPSAEFLPDGKLKRKQESVCIFSSEKEAKKAERDRLNEIDSGKIIINSNSTFYDVAKIFLNYVEDSPEYAKGTHKNYNGYFKNHLTPFHNVKIKDISSLYIEKWLIDMQKAEKSPHIINGCRKFAIASFNYAKKHKLVGYNPFEEMDKASEPDVIRNRFTMEEIIKLLNSCKQNKPRFFCILNVLLFSGMRLGEMSGLKKSDIDYKKHTATINRQYTNWELKDRTKTKKSHRVADLTPTLCDIIKWHIKNTKILSEFIFVDEKGKLLSPKWVEEEFKALLEINGYPKNYLRVHDLRGSYVDIMHSQGIPVVYISRQVGHARTSTTNDIYSAIMNEVHTKAVDILEQIVFKENIL